MSDRDRVRRVEMVAPLRRSGSGTAAFLALASDGREYWVKAPNNPQGSRGLIAERVVYGIGERTGAPVSESALVDIPADLRWDPARGFGLQGGVGHGSLNIQPSVEHDDWGDFSHLDGNRRRQAFILGLWDLCLGEDPQWLHQADEEMSIWTFDHGLWFGGGADWSIPLLRNVGVARWDTDLDPGVASASALRDAADRMDSLSLEELQAVVATVPVEWGTTPTELSELASVLFVRTEGVAERLRVAAGHSRHP